MNYQELTQEEILCWYDGPLIETLRDTDGDVYIAYNDIPYHEILVKVSNELLIKMINNHMSISECFRAGSNKWKWDTEKRDYVEIPEFNPDDLLDDTVYFKDICYFEHDKNYLNTLENKENDESLTVLSKRGIKNDTFQASRNTHIRRPAILLRRRLRGLLWSLLRRNTRYYLEAIQGRCLGSCR